MKKIEDREEAERRKKESNRAAVAKYQERFKRVNCRFEPALYKAIVSTGETANSFIIAAVKEKLNKMGIDYENTL